jgi:hypothetical protein
MRFGCCGKRGSTSARAAASVRHFLRSAWIPVACGVALGSACVAALGRSIELPRPFPDRALLGLWLALPLALPAWAWFALRGLARTLTNALEGEPAEGAAPTVGGLLLETLVAQAVALSLAGTVLDAVFGGRIHAFERVSHPWSWVLADSGRGALCVAIALLIAFIARRLSDRSASRAITAVAAVGLAFNLAAGEWHQARRVDALHAPMGQVVARGGTGLRVIVVGIDGASWPILDRAIAAGGMPKLAQATANGARGTLTAEAPLYSPVSWTTLGTGRSPAEHGITSYARWDFPGCRAELPIRPEAAWLYPLYAVAGGLVATGLVEQGPVTADVRRADELWEMVSAWGGSTLTINWPVSYPPAHGRGRIASDAYFQEWEWVWPQRARLSHASVEPPELAAALSRVTVPPEHWDPEPLRSFGQFDDADWRKLRAGQPNGDPLSMLAWNMAVDANVFASAHELMKAAPADLTLIKSALEDEVVHAFAPYRWPGSFDDVDHDRAQRWGHILDAHHRWLDSELGELFGQADEHTVVMLISDHGYRFLRNNPLSEEAHDPRGVLLAVGGPVRKGLSDVEAVGYDFAPTVLYLLGYPIPPGLTGRVRTDLLDPGFVSAHPVQPAR